MIITNGMGEVAHRVMRHLHRHGRLIGREYTRRMNVAGIDFDFIEERKESPAKGVMYFDALVAEGWSIRYRTTPNYGNSRYQGGGDQAKMLRDLTMVMLSGEIHDG